MSYVAENKKCYYDNGFDFRCHDTTDLNTKKLSFNERIYQLASKFIFNCKAYLFSSSEERKIRQSLLHTAKAEKALSNSSVEWLKKGGSRHAQKLAYAEYEFFKTVGDLLKAVYPNNIFTSPERPFPHELLTPIHFANNCQKRWQRREYYEQGNADADNNIDEFQYIIPLFPLLNQKIEDRDKVDHQAFAASFKDQEIILKKDCKKLRKFIYLSTTDYKKSSDFKKWKYDLEVRLSHFKNSWKAYSQAHEILDDASKVLSEKDHYAQRYENLRKNKGDDSQEKKLGDQSVIDLYKNKYPYSKSGNFFLSQARS